MKLVTFVVALALAALTTSASAEIVTYTFTGVVTFDRDGASQFGGNNFLGESYTATQTIDLSKVSPVKSGGSTTYSGGPIFSNTADFGTSKISIGGFDIPSSGVITGHYYTSVNIQQTGEFSTNVVPRNDASGIEIQQFGLTSPLIGDGITPASIAVTGGSGDYEIQTGGHESLLEFSVTHLDITNDTTVSSVPLPASLPMFGAAILGLAAVGYGVKRRKADQP